MVIALLNRNKALSVFCDFSHAYNPHNTSFPQKALLFLRAFPISSKGGAILAFEAKLCQCLQPISNSTPNHHHINSKIIQSQFILNSISKP
ncbi:MAG: hypothetical protein ACTSRK_10115 [Promethearchaeota archaeon]